MARASFAKFFVAPVIVLLAAPADAQINQVWPEASTYVKLNSETRFYFLATTVRENRQGTEGEFGSNFDFDLKPLKNPKKWMGFQLDESNARYLMVRVGYIGTFISARVTIQTNTAAFSKSRRDIR